MEFISLIRLGEAFDRSFIKGVRSDHDISITYRRAGSLGRPTRYSPPRETHREYRWLIPTRECFLRRVFFSHFEHLFSNSAKWNSLSTSRQIVPTKMSSYRFSLNLLRTFWLIVAWAKNAQRFLQFLENVGQPCVQCLSQFEKLNISCKRFSGKQSQVQMEFWKFTFYTVTFNFGKSKCDIQKYLIRSSSQLTQLYCELLRKIAMNSSENIVYPWRFTGERNFQVHFALLFFSVKFIYSDESVNFQLKLSQFFPGR